MKIKTNTEEIVKSKFSKTSETMNLHLQRAKDRSGLDDSVLTYTAKSVKHLINNIKESFEDDLKKLLTDIDEENYQ